MLVTGHIWCRGFLLVRGGVCPLRPFGVELIWMAANIAATNLKKKVGLFIYLLF